MSAGSYQTDTSLVSDFGPPIQRHTNTDCCPLIYEVIPAHGCDIGCVYCNVYSQKEEKTHYPVTVFQNYPEQLGQHIDSQRGAHPGKSPTYYFSPKTDVFQSALVESGVTKRLLEVLGDKQADYILVTKGRLPGDDIIDLLKRAAPKGRVLISQAMKNDEHVRILEPRAATAKERYYFARRCIENGIPVMGVIEPILPLRDLSFVYEIMDTFMSLGVDHFAVDFARISRVCLEDMIRSLPELAELRDVYYEKDALPQTFETQAYYREDIERYAPSKAYMSEQFQKMNDYVTAKRSTLTICNYFHIPGINQAAYKRGYLCFGIFDPQRAERFAAMEGREQLAEGLVILK